MILPIGMSIGPVIASLIIGSIGASGTGYTYSWIIAAIIASLAAIFILSRKAHLDLEADSPVVPEGR